MIAAVVTPSSPCLCGLVAELESVVAYSTLSNGVEPKSSRKMTSGSNMALTLMLPRATADSKNCSRQDWNRFTATKQEAG